MQPTQKFEEDVAFVREAVEKRDRMQYNSIAIAVLWAIILATGYMLNDFRPDISHLYWPIATFIGFLISFWIAKRAMRARGIIRNAALGPSMAGTGAVCLSLFPLLYSLLCDTVWPWNLR